MRIKVLWFGRPGASPYEPQVETYRQRVARRWPADDCPLRPVAGARRDDQHKVLAAEAERARRQLPRSWSLVALDERGSRLDSAGFARLMAEQQEQGTAGVGFVIGSDLGLDAGLRREARLRLSLSPMTLPHLLARLCLWEQLFRASDILGSGRYHRQGVQ